MLEDTDCANESRSQSVWLCFSCALMVWGDSLSFAFGLSFLKTCVRFEYSIVVVSGIHC